MKGENIKSKRMPAGIILVIMWIVFVIVNYILRGLGREVFLIHQKIFGTSLAVFFLITNIIIFIGVIILLILFILRKRNSWKYFIFFVALILFKDLTELSLLVIFSVIREFVPFLILKIVIYFWVMYSVNKNRGYFNR